MCPNSHNGGEISDPMASRLAQARPGRRGRLLQANHLADGVYQQREQDQDNEEIFYAFAARLFELLIEIQVQSVANTWKSAFRRRRLHARLSRRLISFSLGVLLISSH